MSAISAFLLHVRIERVPPSSSTTFIICLCSGAPLAELFIRSDSTFHQSAPPPFFFHMQPTVTCGSTGKPGIYSSNSPPLEPVLTLHWGHFWAFLCPCSITLAQVRSSLSPFLYSRHFSPLCHGAWHLKHHTNWQLLHWICKTESEACDAFVAT